MENKEPLTHLMDFLFGPIHSSETPYLTINYVSINIQKYYSISRCVIFIIIMIAPTDIIRDCYKFNHR